jgi:CDP-2,3-bis-(O-geranylgeranyl)-sn-glycerol synthase
MSVTVEEALVIIVQAFFAMLPAYVAGPAAVLTGGGAPMDGGRVWRDGNRILGDGKTWRGLLGGTVAGVALAGILSVAVRASGVDVLTDFTVPGWDTHLSWLWVGLMMAFGSLMGDFIKSFFKRRTGAKRGAKSPVIDMYDFILGSWLLAAVLANPWFAETFWPDDLGFPWHLVVVLVISPALHRSVNIIGYKMGKKDVPW